MSLKRICHQVFSMSHPCWLPHLPFTTSTSSSSFTLPSTTTQETRSTSGTNKNKLREHPVHHAHLQALPVDRLRHQESLWRKNLQSGGNPRTTTPTVLRVTGCTHTTFNLCAQRPKTAEQPVDLIIELHPGTCSHVVFDETSGVSQVVGCVAGRAVVPLYVGRY